MAVKPTKLVLTPKVSPGYAKARMKIEARVNAVVGEFYNKYGFNEFTYSSIELSRRCGTRDYATQYRDKLLAQLYRGNSISKKVSVYRIREENFTPEIQEAAKQVQETKPVELREVPEDFDEMRYVTFNLANIQQAIPNNTFEQSEKYKLRMLERALLVYGVQEDPNNENLVTLAIPHNQIGCRLYATWPFCLQCTSSDIRQMSIYGDSVDLDAAAVQCMIELGTKFEGSEKEIAVLKNYVENKRALRKELAEKYALDEDKIKCIFNIMVLGGHGSPAQVAANYRDTNSIARMVGNSMLASEIVSHQIFSDFYRAVKSLRRLIVESMVVEVETGWKVINDSGFTKVWHKKAGTKRHVKPVPKMMSHIYQGWELATMSINTESIGDRGLPVHDSREGIPVLEGICNSFDDNNIRYEVKVNPNHQRTRFMFPELPTESIPSPH